jgi:lipoprotein-anchoring transpeptidase ErfK/SrfK
MLWTSKLSEMEKEKVLNNDAQSGIGNSNDGTDQGTNKKIPVQDDNSALKSQSGNALLRIGKFILIFIGSIFITLSLILFFLYCVPLLKEFAPKGKTKFANNSDLKKDANYKKQIGLLSKDVQHLALKFNAYTSGQSYIVVNTTENRFYLYTNKKLVRAGFCSTGSLTMLKTEKGDKFWVFKTPRGKRTIHGKITNPSWNRPDWSFIEEGLPIPPKNSPARYESGVLGDYAMSIGDGYLIHGTIYKRFLGMPVTHGCVRLNDEDLDVVYHTLNIGSKVYIF